METGYGRTWRVTPDLLGILSASGLFENTNPAWFATLGLRPEEIESKPFFEFVHPDDIARTQAAFAAIQRGKPILKFENRYRHKDGSYRWLSWNAVPEGQRFYCNARDVTQEKENAAALQTREQEARFREQFIAVLGHDLRNPLAAINAAARMIRRDPGGEMTLDLLDTIDGSVGRMAALIADTMDFARTRLGDGIGLNVTAVDLRPELEHAVAEIQIAHPQSLIAATFDLPDQVACDAKRISQLLSNLLSNAVQHGATGQPIGVAARITCGDFCLSVSNTGDPIPEKTQSLLFRPFLRADTRDSAHGLGLGLYIAAEIARAHGGILDVTSDVTETRFTCRFPLIQPH